MKETRKTKGLNPIEHGHTGTGPWPRPSAGAELPDQLNVAMRADGGFDSREIFRLCRLPGITPYIRIGHNATTRSQGVSRDRGLAALDQLGGGITDPAKFARLTKDEREANRREWRKRVRYGKRWRSRWRHDHSRGRSGTRWPPAGGTTSRRRSASRRTSTTTCCGCNGRQYPWREHALRKPEDGGLGGGGYDTN